MSYSPVQIIPPTELDAAVHPVFYFIWLAIFGAITLVWATKLISSPEMTGFIATGAAAVCTLATIPLAKRASRIRRELIAKTQSADKN